MRTTLDLDEALLLEALAAIGARSKREAVETALREAVASRNRRELVGRLGTFKFDMDWEELHRMREDE